MADRNIKSVHIFTLIVKFLVTPSPSFRSTIFLISFSVSMALNERIDDDALASPILIRRRVQSESVVIDERRHRVKSSFRIACHSITTSISLEKP